MNFNRDGRITNGPEDRETAVCVVLLVHSRFLDLQE